MDSLLWTKANTYQNKPPGKLRRSFQGVPSLLFMEVVFEAAWFPSPGACGRWVLEVAAPTVIKDTLKIGNTVWNEATIPCQKSSAPVTTSQQKKCERWCFV
jgi:hypothetical protein